MREKRGLRLVCMILVMVIGVAFMPASGLAASKTRTMKTYDAIVKGKTVYCTDGHSIYKVNKKTKKVKKILKRVPVDEGIVDLKKSGKYIYYIHGDTEGAFLCRVKASGGKEQKLTSIYSYVHGYYIKKGKVYAHYYDMTKDKDVKRVMKPNGKGKKITSVKAQNKHKASNKKGYKINSYTEKTSYLLLPKGKKIKLGKRW